LGRKWLTNGQADRVWRNGACAQNLDGSSTAAAAASAAALLVQMCVRQISNMPIDAKMMVPAGSFRLELMRRPNGRPNIAAKIAP
jgi:hypothetical protein